ncbi:MAG: hypothetical protein HC871_10680 [Rhizobiales bacterium]|nr:hypothetical protein [Hyphomicrobiales bacterium]
MDFEKYTERARGFVAVLDIAKGQFEIAAVGCGHDEGEDGAVDISGKMIGKGSQIAHAVSDSNYPVRSPGVCCFRQSHEWKFNLKEISLRMDSQPLHGHPRLSIRHCDWQVERVWNFFVAFSAC